MARLRSLRIGEPVELDPHLELGIELIAKTRGISQQDVVRNAVAAYVAVWWDADHPEHLEALKHTHAEPDLAAWQRGEPALPDEAGES